MEFEAVQSGFAEKRRRKMNESGNYAEYTVSRKAEGKYLKVKLFWMAIYGVLIAAYLGVLLALKDYGVLVVIVTLPFVPLGVMVLRHLTWNRFVAVDQKYEIANAKITLYQVCGKKATQVFSELVSAFTLIAPVNEKYKDEYESADEVIDFRGSFKSPDSYFLRLDKDGKKTIIFIEATNKAVKVMKFYNSKGLVASETPLRY